MPCRSLLKQYITSELMNWSNVAQEFEKELRQGSEENPCTEVFSNNEEGNKRWDDFRKRIVEHVSMSMQAHWILSMIESE